MGYISSRTNELHLQSRVHLHPALLGTKVVPSVILRIITIDLARCCCHSVLSRARYFPNLSLSLSPCISVALSRSLPLSVSLFFLALQVYFRACKRPL